MPPLVFMAAAYRRRTNIDNRISRSGLRRMHCSRRMRRPSKINHTHPIILTRTLLVRRGCCVYVALPLLDLSESGCGPEPENCQNDRVKLRTDIARAPSPESATERTTLYDNQPTGSGRAPQGCGKGGLAPARYQGQVNEMADWWETQYTLISTDWLAFLLQGDPIAIIFLLVVVLFGYLTWIGIRVVWEYLRSR